MGSSQLILLILLITAVHGAVREYRNYQLRNPCPTGRKPGDVWMPEGQGCSRCACNNVGYSCFTCGAFSVAVIPNCYIGEGPSSKGYPECCAPHIYCKGMRGFNQTLYEKYMREHGPSYDIINSEK